MKEHLKKNWLTYFSITVAFLMVIFDIIFKFDFKRGLFDILAIIEYILIFSYIFCLISNLVRFINNDTRIISTICIILLLAGAKFSSKDLEKEYIETFNKTKINESIKK